MYLAGISFVKTGVGTGLGRGIKDLSMDFTCRGCWTMREWSWVSALECLSMRRTHEKAKKTGGGVLIFKKSVVDTMG